MTALFFVLFFGTMLLLGMPLFASITVTVATMAAVFCRKLRIHAGESGNLDDERFAQ